MPRLEFAFDPADLSRLARWPGMRAGRAFPTTIEWHDTPDGSLAADDTVLSNTAGTWRLMPLHPASPIVAPAARGQGRHPALLGIDLPTGIATQACFTGRRRTMQWADGVETVALVLLDGRFDGAAPGVSAGVAPGIARITIEGNAAALTPLATALAQDFGLHVPRCGFAEQALAGCRGETAPPRALGAPTVPAHSSVSDSLTVILAHLTDVMLHWAAAVPTAHTPEPVHQMRVATRRLRSALSVYKPVVACAELTALSVPLRICASRLGTARDWDVFIDGLGARLANAFPGDPRCTAMLRAANHRRRQAYKDLNMFLAGPDFRTLAVALACTAALRPWDTAASPSHATADHLRQDTAAFAASVLAKRLKRVRQAGRGMAGLSVPALHELRKDCKRLRYAAEFFSSLFPGRKTKRFLQRLADLQEELGLLNDSAAVSGLMAQLGRLERSYAAGLVEGFSAAHAGPARGLIEQAWKRFRATPRFWAD